jgi:hypothetical protein
MKSPPRGPERREPRRTLRRWTLELLVLLGAVGWAIVSLQEPFVPEWQVVDRPIQVPDDGYVSSEACKSCHPSQYATWRSSFHRSMTQIASPETVRADFDGVRVGSVQGEPMLLERRETAFWAEFDDPQWSGQGESPPRIRRQVVMITGSHHQQVYWYRTEHTRFIGQLPGIYLIAERRWIPRGAALLHPPTGRPGSEIGRWNAVCINCHATHGKRALDGPFGSQSIDGQISNTTVAEFGVACEACHGPGEQHVRMNRSPLRRYALHLTGRPDPTTVQPQRLNPRLSSDVCGQCHGVWEFYDEAGEREANWNGLPFRPGAQLATTRFVAQPSTNIASPTMKRLLAAYPEFLEDSFWSDGMVRVSGREYNGLVESPCFKSAVDEKRMMSCFSCHTMHKTPNDPRSTAEWADTHQLSVNMNGREACLQCHSTFRANVTSHTNHAASSTGSDCYNCHMPYTSYGLLRALRSHQISSPTVVESVDAGRPNACNLCHLDKTLQWTAAYLEKWYGPPGATLSEDQQTIAASLLWLLRGDAGQRALVAWSLGWPPAQAASGTSWMGVFAAQLLEDPYDAVRFIASRSLGSLPGFADFDYDFVVPPSERFAATVRALETWRRVRKADSRTDAQLLFESDGSPNVDLITRLLRQRNDRRVVLRE